MNNPMDAFYCAIQGVGAGIGAGLGETVIPLIPFAIVFGGGLYCASYLTENLVVPWMYSRIPNVHGIDFDPSFGLPHVTPGGSVINVPVSTGGIDIGTPYGNVRLPGFDLSVPYQMPVVSPFPLPQQTAPIVQSFDIHLGIREEEYKDWINRGYVQNPDEWRGVEYANASHFPDYFSEVAGRASKIYLDIAGLSMQSAKAYQQHEIGGRRTIPRDYDSANDKYGFTAWELYAIMRDYRLFDKTTFTENGVSISAERWLEFITGYRDN